MSRRRVDLQGSWWAAVGFAAALLASVCKLGLAFAQVQFELAYVRGERLLDSPIVESAAIWNLFAYVFSLGALVALLAAVFSGRQQRNVA